MAKLEGLESFLECLIPVIGDKKWHEAHVQLRRNKSKKEEENYPVVSSYINEGAFYLVKYGVFAIVIAKTAEYLLEKI